VEISKESKLPEGIGRKIVDALKKQSESIEESCESNIFEEQNDNVFTGYEKQDLSEKFDNSYVSEDYSGSNVEEDEEFVYDNQIEDSEFESYEPYQEAVDNDFEAVSEDFDESVQEIKETVYEQPKNEYIYEQTNEIFAAKEQKPFNFKNDLQPPSREKQQPITSDINFPSNVEVLRKLISELPAGVTRQTGAQIIRQTMEAMGISMNSVLTEAQSVQENLGDSTKDCMNTIEEYRNNIKILEKKAQNYKRQADQLADLINLFIVTER